MPHAYFAKFDATYPAHVPHMSKQREMLWHFLAGVTIALAVRYLWWRWTASLNPDALTFSIIVALAETLCFIGTLIFFHDIWREGDTPRQPAPRHPADVGLDAEDANAPITVDVFITTYDENRAVVAPSIQDAKALLLPPNVTMTIHILDDGNRPAFRKLAQDLQVNYITRTTNEGFKAGNLKNALLQTCGDFVVICDADTRVLPSFLQNTLGYFRDPRVAWVQTPHWFYDIPQGESWRHWLQRKIGRGAVWLAHPLAWLTGTSRIGRDPFLSDPVLFFDVIQRRRNRHGASFCCGAGSIHRREAVLGAALQRKTDQVSDLAHRLRTRNLMPLNTGITLEPYKFHVSEDIFTSILLHGDAHHRWTSVYHPQVEARMLSPWSVHAWATQRLKYAGGTFDIMLRANPLANRHMPWRTRLHYLATFWSYISSLWIAVLLLAPAVSLVTAQAPVQAYSMNFFSRFLPMILLNELAMAVACKGYDLRPGRLMGVATLHIQARAFWSVLRGERPRFPPTPKTPLMSGGLRMVLPSIALLMALALAGIFGLIQYMRDVPGYALPFLIVNLFWLAWNMTAIGRVVLSVAWNPQAELSHPLPKPEVSAHGSQAVSA